MIDEFISEAVVYCERRNIKLATLGAYSVGDRTLFSRLKNNGQCLPRTMDRVRSYMRDNPPNVQSDEAA